VGIGGSCTAIYPVNTPGGYYLLGRTPVPIWNPQRDMPEFRSSSVLLVPGDRLKFVPIEKEEFEEIEQMVRERKYRINIVSYEKFSVGAYRKWFTERAAYKVEGVKA